MNPNFLIEAAIECAVIKHGGQKDKGGFPYILHVLRVGMAQYPDIKAMVAGFLHDVVEDCGVTLNQIEKEFGGDVAQIVARMTHVPGETYEEYIMHIAADPVARKIKLADIHDNLIPERLYAAARNGANITSLFVKYSQALRILSGNYPLTSSRTNGILYLP